MRAVGFLSGVFEGQRLPEPLPCPVCGGWAWPLGREADFWCPRCLWKSWAREGKAAARGPKARRPLAVPPGVVAAVGPRRLVDRWGNTVIRHEGGW